MKTRKLEVAIYDINSYLSTEMMTSRNLLWKPQVNTNNLKYAQLFDGCVATPVQEENHQQVKEDICLSKVRRTS